MRYARAVLPLLVGITVLVALFAAARPATAQTTVPGTPTGYYWAPMQISVDNPRLSITYVGGGYHTFDWEEDFFHNQVTVNRHLPDGNVHALAFHLDSWNSTATFSLGSGGDIYQSSWLVHYYQDYLEAADFPWADNFRSSLQFNAFSTWTFTKGPFIPSVSASGAFTVWALIEGDPPTNEFGLSCTYTASTGVTNTVSASRVNNGSFEYYNYSDVPSGWTINSPGSSFYATTTEAYDGNYSLQYQPNSYRMFAQVCRSVQIPLNTQSIAAGVMYSGGGASTSDVTLMFDGEILGTTTVSGSAAWTTLAASDSYSSESIIHTVCVEVEGANHAYVDAVWLYASETNDLAGLSCPVPEDDVVPPPPPPPPEPDEDDGIPVMPPGSFGVCTRCIKPWSLLMIGSWIKWLLCGIENVFRCELFIWLEAIRNLVAGIFGRFIELALWFPNMFQSALDWLAATATNILNWAIQMWDYIRTGFTQFLRVLVQRILESAIVQLAYAALSWLGAIWEFAWAIIQAILGQLRALFFAIANVIDLIISIITSVVEAWTAPAYTLDFIPGISGQGPGSFAPLEADGINDTKIYWILVSGMATFDAIAGDFGFQYLQFILIGIMAFGVIAWTFKQFHEILPI